MNTEVQTKLVSLYDIDYQRWLHQTTAQLRSHDFDNLDLENLVEEIESLGRRDQRAISSYLTRLCEHLLKLKYWDSERERCFRSWILEISNFRLEIELILKDSPSLKPFLHENFLPCYQRARKNMLKVIPSDLVPEEPNFTLEQALDEDWLPWQPKSFT
ncbi:hypothetical protein C1752_00177 [Acaryochloris thomasi RCC1774]|uniref:DUF29 domain-containing protein n=1 Tax=Acaryochloris thomasi RCC1774 TaxID=1764569 RepID=A0A2W1K6P7_9CYAN|nr:DUF29 domain-containing protein [Acaryochloris thomasi]PZD75381.1 hypothetical protein C1752_00177 [Acaryochloris thomasi RCC1774]